MIMSPKYEMAVQVESEKPEILREEVAAAFKRDFEKNASLHQQYLQELDLWIKYRSNLSLPEEIGKYKIDEAHFPLQPGAQPVHGPPYFTSPWRLCLMSFT